MADRRPDAGLSAKTDHPISRILSSFGATRFDQDPLNRSTHGDGSTLETMSHAQTTGQIREEDVESIFRSPSIYSYNSTRDGTRFVREAFGRKYNALNDAYLLPTDDAEWGRLDKQHSSLLVAFGGLYPCPDTVDALLAPTGDLPKRILDVGCGTGSWAIEMATRFPHAEVLGIDLAPTPLDPGTVPLNLYFEIDDVNKGLEHLHGQYDVIHVRCIMTGITDPDATIPDLIRCLKPGGLLILIDGDKDFLDEQRRKIKMLKIPGDEDVSSVSEDGSMFQRIMWEAHEASKLAGSGLERGIEMIDHGLWDQALCDPETAGCASVFLPVGPWARCLNLMENEVLKYAAILMRQNFLKVHQAFQGILRRNGISQETLDEWSRLCHEELSTMKFKIWCRYRVAWARRRAEDGGPAPALAAPSPKSDRSSSGSEGKGSKEINPSIPSFFSAKERHHYPAVDLYASREEAAEARRRRLATIGEWPTPAVERT